MVHELHVSRVQISIIAVWGRHSKSDVLLFLKVKPPMSQLVPTWPITLHAVASASFHLSIFFPSLLFFFISQLPSIYPHSLLSPLFLSTSPDLALTTTLHLSIELFLSSSPRLFRSFCWLYWLYPD